MASDWLTAVLSANQMPGLKIFGVGFDHGLPCRVKNMAQGNQ